MNPVGRIFLAASALLLPAFALADAAGKPLIPAHDIETVDHRLVGVQTLRDKVVVYVFWATWCPVCVSEMPEFARLYETFRARGLEVVAVALDEDSGIVADFWRQSGYRFPATMRSDDMREKFGRIIGTPTVVVVDRKGEQRLRHLGASSFPELEALIRSLL